MLQDVTCKYLSHLLGWFCCVACWCRSVKMKVMPFYISYTVQSIIMAKTDQNKKKTIQRA